MKKFKKYGLLVISLVVIGISLSSWNTVPDPYSFAIIRGDNGGVYSVPYERVVDAMPIGHGIQYSLESCMKELERHPKALVADYDLHRCVCTLYGK